MREVYISVDIEAAGPVPPAYSMLSLGAVAVDAPQATFYIELRPVNDKAVSEAMKVVGRTLREFTKSGQDPKIAMMAFYDWLISVAKDGKLVFVGFNATFDWAFINFYFHQYLGKNPFGIGGVDIKSYYMGLAGCAWEDTRSSKIPAEFKDTSLHHTHNALDDAIEQAEIFRQIRNRSIRNK